MRNSVLIFLALIILSTCQFKNPEYKSHVTLQSKVPSHPRLLMLANQEASIKKAIESDTTWRSVHEVIIKQCNRILEKPPVEFKLSGKRLLDKSAECRKRVFYLSYAWRMTHEKKYLDRAEKELLAVCSFDNWNPSHFLDVAEMTMAVSIGYDWLFNSLSKTTLSILKESIVRKGLQPSFEKENNWWLTSDGNWNQVCNAGMTFGALAIYDQEPELAAKIINRAIETISLTMKVYDPDGAYPEGYAYWGYGTTFNVLFLDALEKAFLSNYNLLNNSGFMKTGEYLANMVGPTGLSFNYSDGNPKGRLNPAMFWFAQKQSNNTLLFTERTYLKDKKELTSVKELPAVLIWGAGMDLKNIPAPKTLLWVGRGTNPVSLMRSSWKTDGIFVGIKGGSASIGHAHMDAGSFVMDAMGERWAMDFRSQEYGSIESTGIDLWSLKQNSERWKLFRNNNLAHNTLAFNNQFQLVNGNAPILQHTQDSSFISTVIDLTSIYKTSVKKVLRGAVIVDKQYVVISDEIELANSPSTLRWTLVTSAEAKILSDSTAELTQNGKQLLLKVKGAKHVKMKTWSTVPKNSYEERNAGTMLIGYEVNLPANFKGSLSTYLIPQQGSVIEKKIKPLSFWK